MDITQIIGLAAAALTTVSGLPQLIRIMKLKETRDISLEMYLLMSTGLTLWLIYGIIIKNTPIILANVVSILISLTILGFKLKYK